jgi:2-dehydropantoate 2-reductase
LGLRLDQQNACGGSMRIVVLGTGALGCVFSARLADLAETWMLGTWSEGLAAVQRGGVTVQEPDGRLRTAEVHACGDPGCVPPADIALILVKSYQTNRAAAWAAQVLRAGGLAVTLQNGLDNGAKIAAAVGEDRVALGVTYSGATMLGPGRVRLVANLPTHLEDRPPLACAVAQLVALLTEAGLEAHATNDIRGRLWGKAIANAAINPLSALWRVSNSDVCEGWERRTLMAMLAREATAVAHARGVTLPFEDTVAYVESVCRATGKNRSSMLQDVESGRPTEIDSINGVVIEEGRRLGIATPANEVIRLLVLGLTPVAE